MTDYAAVVTSDLPRIVYRGTRRITANAAWRAYCARWHWYPLLRQLPDFVQVVSDENGELDLRVWAEHRKGCGMQWHQLHIHTEPLGDGTILGEMQYVILSCGMKVKPAEISGVMCPGMCEI